MAQITLQTSNLGFITVQREPAGYVGGLLVTNRWGRPLEFRLSSPVLPNKVQQILYGPTMEPYLCSDLIGKKLLEKTATPVQFVFTDQLASLDVRLHVAMPVGLVGGEESIADCGLRIADSRTTSSNPQSAIRNPQSSVRCHAHFPADAATLQELLEQLGGFDLGDPFVRIREALAEARKLGVSNRAA